MKLYIDCLPCVLRQVLEASRMSTESTKLQEKIMDKAIGLLNKYKTYNNAPELVRDMQRIVKDITKINDPYRKIKQRDIQTALKLYPKLKQYIKEQDPLYWALKVAATGNVLDSGIYYDYGIENVLENVPILLPPDPMSQG